MPSKRKVTQSKDSNEHTAIKYYRLGCHLLKRKETLKKKVRDEEWVHLAAMVGLKVDPAGSDEVRYKSIELAKLFGSEQSELQRLCRKRTRSGKGEKVFQITLSHVLELMKLPEAHLRDEFADLAVQAKLSCLALRAAIRKRTRWKSNRPGAGRPNEPPQSEAHAVLRAERDCQSVTATLKWLETNAKRKLSRPLKQRLTIAIDAIFGSLKEAKKLLID